MISKTGRVIVRLEKLMDTHARREDGSESILLADTRFDNHNKMTITGIVQYGTDAPDTNPLEDADLLMPRCHHYPIGYVGGGVFPVDIRPGDRVWFHYLCAENKASMERNSDGTWDVYMQVSDIFVIERGRPQLNVNSEGFMSGLYSQKQLIMNQNWVLGDEVKESTLVLFDALGDKKPTKMTPKGGIELLKGFNVDSYVDEAVLHHIDPVRYRGVSDEVKVGDRLYLSKDSTFGNVIHNKQRLLFRHTDILAKWHKDNDKVIPVGENHLVRVQLNEYKSTVIKHTVITKAPEWATIIASGANCKYGKPGDKIMFTRRFTRLLDKEFWIVSDSEIQAILK